MSSENNILLTPFQIGKVTIKNRFVMGPMGFPIYDSFGALREDGIEYYTERAKGGFGLIVLGERLVDERVEPLSPKASASILYAPGRYIKSANRLVERCESYGTKVFGEMAFGPGRNYAGRRTPSELEVWMNPGVKSIPLTKDEIHQKQECMIEAAKVMKNAGFAGVDLHALHWGYLLDEFLMSITNHREDEYGGCLENRVRVVTEIIQGIHQVCGDDFPVTVGLGVKSYMKALNKASLTGEEEAGRTLEEAIEIAKLLEKAGIAAIMTDVGVYDSFYHACPPSYMPKGHGLELYAKVKENVNVPIIGRSRLGDPALCEKAVRSGQVDAVALARPALADPYFPRKVEMGIPEKIRPCIGCNVGCMGNLVEKGLLGGCAVNPRSCRELYTPAKKAVSPRKIAVIGGGAAGMQAAITAAECGHTVELFEKRNVLGGEMIAAGAHSTKQEVREFKDWQIRELNEKNVVIHMETTITADEVKAQGFDTVILATGAASIMPKSIVGIEKAISAETLLEGEAPTGKKVIVVGGGMVGCETAVGLAQDGNEVTLLEALPEIMGVKYVPIQHKMMLMDMIEHYHIRVATGTKLVEVTDTGAVVASVDNEKETENLSADLVVMSIGLKPNPSLAPDFYGKGLAVYEIGSAQTAGDIYTAIHQGFEVAYYLD